MTTEPMSRRLRGRWTPREIATYGTEDEGEI